MDSLTFCDMWESTRNHRNPQENVSFFLEIMIHISDLMRSPIQKGKLKPGCTRKTLYTDKEMNITKHIISRKVCYQWRERGHQGHWSRKSFWFWYHMVPDGRRVYKLTLDIAFSKPQSSLRARFYDCTMKGKRFFPQREKKIKDASAQCGKRRSTTCSQRTLSKKLWQWK